LLKTSETQPPNFYKSGEISLNMEKDNIPEMELNKNHKESKIEEPKDPEKMQKEMEKTT
jgi:hypothetical protein